MNAFPALRLVRSVNSTGLQSHHPILLSSSIDQAERVLLSDLSSGDKLADGRRLHCYAVVLRNYCVFPLACLNLAVWPQMYGGQQAFMSTLTNGNSFVLN